MSGKRIKHLRSTLKRVAREPTGSMSEAGAAFVASGSWLDAGHLADCIWQAMWDAALDAAPAADAGRVDARRVTAASAAGKWVRLHAVPDRIVLTKGALANLSSVIDEAIQQSTAALERDLATERRRIERAIEHGASANYCAVAEMVAILNGDSDA